MLVNIYRFSKRYDLSGKITLLLASRYNTS